jgi:hypothetical protein
MGIEEMFGNCKTGGYNLEETGLKGERLIKIILLMTLAPIVPLYFKGLKSKKSKCNNMYLAQKNSKKI